MLQIYDWRTSEGRGNTLLAALVIVAALAANSPVVSIQRAEAARPAIPIQKTEQREDIEKRNQNFSNLGATPTSPLYIKASCDHGCGHIEEDGGFWKKVWTDPIAGFTGLLFVSTLLLWLVSVITLRDNRRASQLQLRPYVLVDHHEMAWFHDVNNPAIVAGHRYILTWKNSGQTPAKNVWTSINIGNFDPDKTPEFCNYVDANPPFIVGAIGPNQSKEIRISIPVALMTAAWTGPKKLYYWGWIEYDGLDTARHRSEICGNLEINSDPSTKAPLFYIDASTTAFNGMDEACLHPVKT